MRFLCGNDTVAVAMHFAMKNGKFCFSLRKFLAISLAIQKIASDCGCDAVVLCSFPTLFRNCPGALPLKAENPLGATRPLSKTIPSLSGPVLRDTARLSQRYPRRLRAMGFLVSQHGQSGAIPPPPFSERFPHEEHAKWRCDTPPLKRGISQRYWRDTP